MSTLPNISIDRAIFRTNEHLALVGLAAEGIVFQHVAAISGRLLADSARQVCDVYSGIEELATAVPIAQWREAYRQEGLKPSRFRSSIESLIRRVARGDSVSVSPLVDLYNAVSLKFRIPLGALDLALLPEADIRFRYARPEADRFSPLGGEATDFPLSTNLPVYASGNEVLCWGFNSRDSRVTALRLETESALFLTEVIDPGERENAVEAMHFLAQLLEGGTKLLTIGLLDRDQPEWQPAAARERQSWRHEIEPSEARSLRGLRANC